MDLDQRVPENLPLWVVSSVKTGSMGVVPKVGILCTTGQQYFVLPEDDIGALA